MTAKRTLLTGVVAIAAAAIGVGAAVVSARHHEPASSLETPGTANATTVRALHFTSKADSSGYVDNARKGWSTGDLLTQHSTWYQGGTAVADMALTASVTRRTGAQTGEVVFTAVAGLKDGDVVLTGRFDVVPENQTFQAAVTGGTGMYTDAHGHAVFEQVPGDKTLVTLYLPA